MHIYCCILTNLSFLHHSPSLVQFSSVAQLCPTFCYPMDCSTPGFPVHHYRVSSNSCPLSLWCHSTISSSVVPFSSYFQSFPALGSFSKSQLFASGGQSIFQLQHQFFHSPSYEQSFQCAICVSVFLVSLEIMYWYFEIDFYFYG